MRILISFRGPFFEVGIDLELDLDFPGVHGASLYDLDEVNDDLELDFIVENRAQTEKPMSYSFWNAF